MFSGDLRVKSLSSLDTACVTVNGSITLQSGRVTVEGCRNHNNNVNIGAGGALHVAGDLRLRGGSLDVICMPEQGVAAWSGGAAHVAGGFHCGWKLALICGDSEYGLGAARLPKTRIIRFDAYQETKRGSLYSEDYYPMHPHFVCTITAPKLSCREPGHRSWRVQR